MIVSSHTPWWAGPASKLMEVTNYVKDTFSTAKKGNGAGKKKSKGIKAEVLDSLFRPMSPVEEYTAGFAQVRLQHRFTSFLCLYVFIS